MADQTQNKNFSEEMMSLGQLKRPVHVEDEMPLGSLPSPQHMKLTESLELARLGRGSSKGMNNGKGIGQSL